MAPRVAGAGGSPQGNTGLSGVGSPLYLCHLAIYPISKQFLRSRYEENRGLRPTGEFPELVSLTWAAQDTSVTISSRTIHARNHYFLMCCRAM